jgi:aminoglycoside phosphotransferase (APT) family kinase protein
VLPGGRSGVTLTAAVQGTESACREVVVKAAPAGRSPVGRHDVLRQARIMSALASEPGIAVPHILATGTTPAHFYVMSRARGDASEPVLDAAAVKPPPALVRQRALAAARMLARLHLVSSIPPPPDLPAEPAADLGAEVARWRATANAADPQILVGGSQLADSLERSMPVCAAPVLVHGDYRLGNIVFDGNRATGLIDWEIWSRTDPGIDLGWFLVFCDSSLFPGIGQPVDGMPSSAELVEHYTAAGGPPVTDQRWYEAFGRFKMAAIMAHNLRRHREGRHVDPFQETLPPTIARLVATASELTAA